MFHAKLTTDAHEEPLVFIAFTRETLRDLIAGRNILLSVKQEIPVGPLVVLAAEAHWDFEQQIRDFIEASGHEIVSTYETPGYRAERLATEGIDPHKPNTKELPDVPHADDPSKN